MATIVKLTFFEVRGGKHSPFPFDMLRYDQAWPATEPDALAANRTHDLLSLVDREIVTIRLYKLGSARPNIDRWRSMGWVVQPSSINVTKHTVE